MLFSRFVGVAAIVATAGLHSARCQEPDPIVVASYNVENWLQMDRTIDGKTIPGQPKPEEEKRAVVDVIAGIKPDVLGIVEIGVQADFDDLRDRLATRGLDYPHAELLQANDKDRHVALLSKFPISELNSQSEVVVNLNGVERQMERGILDVTVQVNPDYALRVIGVHLKSKREIPDYSQSEMRAKEALELKNYVNQILESDPDANVMLFGDFNDTRNEYPIREIIGKSGTPLSLTALDLADPVGDRWTHYWSYADLYSRIDYLMASPGLVPEVITAPTGVDRSAGWNDGSDHRAIFTAIIPQEK